MMKLVGMKRLVGGAVVFAALAILVIAQTVLATPGSGVTSTLFAVGTFDGIEAKSKTGNHRVRLRAKGATDVHILENRIAPGGTFGWHSHPGPSIVVVKSGALTMYHGDDPTCTPHVFMAGSGFVDQGNAVHVVRNEGDVDAVVYVTSIIPGGAERRIDEPDPGHCGF
jgi:quercetin dioxygenase-like cupin family protein